MRADTRDDTGYIYATSSKLRKLRALAISPISNYTALCTISARVWRKEHNLFSDRPIRPR